MSLRRLSLGAVALILFPCTLAQQGGSQPTATPAAAVQPTSVLADVHVSPHSFTSTYFRTLPLANGRFTLRQGTLLNLIALAYGVEGNAVSGGPPWLDYDRFDLTLQVPPGTTLDTAKLALRTVLADRFKLVSHADTKPLPALLLTVGKGEPKLKQAVDGANDPGCQFHPPTPPPQPGGTMPTSFTFSCRSMTMEAYGQDLRRMSRETAEKPVLDKTGLKGAFDFDITYNLQPNGQGLAVSDAIEKQLGLKLEPGTAPQQVIEVDSVMERPTPNPPGIEKILPPPPPPAFDVAVIKPTEPAGARDLQIRYMDGTQITFTGATLQALIGYAYDVSGAMVDGPAFYSKLRWDIVAKVAPDPNAPKGPNGRGQFINQDDLRLMVRSLLADRFLLKTHPDDRPIDAYTLYPGNPKMKKADPANRTSCKDGPPAGEKDPRIANPTIARVVTCQNITMSQFATEIQGYALDYIKTPVLDLSKLDGSYDFTLSFSSSRVARGATTVGPNGQEVAVDPTASNDPTGAISLPDAISKQLGLKLVLEKRSAPMVVVDHLEETPTDN